MTAENITSIGRTVSDDSPVFEGTPVLVKELHDHMSGDWNLYGFLHKFPSVSREQALDEIEKTVRTTAKRIISCDRGCAPVFKGSETPVKCLFDYLADGRGLKDFHWDFPATLVKDTWDAVGISGRILELYAYRGLVTGIVRSDRAFVSGAPIFTGTRLPIRILFDLLADGQTLKDFYYQYPSAAPDDLVAVIGAAGKALDKEARAAVT